MRLLRRGSGPYGVLVILFIAQMVRSNSDSYVRPPSIPSAPALPSTLQSNDPITPSNLKTAPVINAVSAMCSSDGITASLSFDRPFSGKIYSRDYSTVPECIYYDGGAQHTVLFSIPAHRCGTKLTRTTRNVIDQMENRIYVQMDKETQTVADKQFAFVCQLAAGEAEIGGSKDIGDYYKLPPSIVPSKPSSPPLVSPSSDLTTKYTLPPLPAPLPNNQYPTPSPQQDPIVPINSDAIRRVAAVSQDTHFGNWPIPGAQPFNPNMKPVASWPVPFSASSITASNVDNHYPGIPWYARSEPHFANSIEPYVVSRQKATTILPGPILPPVSPLTPLPRAPPMPSQLNMDIHRPSIPPSIQPFVFSPFVGVRTESVSLDNDPSQVQARPWNDNRDLSIDGKEAYAVPHGHKGKTIASFSSSTHRPTITGLHALPAHDNDDLDMSVTQKPLVEGGRGQGNVDLEKLEGGVTDGSITRDFTTPSLSESIDIDDSEGVNNEDKGSENDVQNVGKMVASQDASVVNSAVFLEIQKGLGPHDPTISRPVKIGDNITLVVRANSSLKGKNEFDMFVHSCFATDGPGKNKVELIDRNGCVARPTVVGPMSRTRDSYGQQLYFFRISAFKFPGPDDVYFSCSVDMTPGRPAPEVCRSSTSRKRRELFNRAILDGTANSLRLFDNVKVEVNGQDEGYRARREVPEALSSSSVLCLDSTTLVLSFIVIALLLVGLLVSSIAAVRLSIKLQNLQMNKVY